MFNRDFYPTAPHVVATMCEGLTIEGKRFFEPQGGKGDIVDWLMDNGAKEVLAAENDEQLVKILGTKARMIARDSFTVTSDQISHIDAVIMNPPFRNGADHLLHIWDIAPAGCEIRCLLNYANFESLDTKAKQHVKQLADQHGSVDNLGDVFGKGAERGTKADIALVKMKKPGTSYSTEFDGFFMEEEPEEAGEYGIMSYNVVRDIVNRYVQAVKLFDQQQQIGTQMNSVIGGWLESPLAFKCTQNDIPVQREQFKKDLQRSGWSKIFNMMKMEKHSTQSMKDEINKFIEDQKGYPFTMKNIYRMLEIMIGTTSSRMDKALEVMFDKLTERADENKFYSGEKWKTNKHYYLNRQFIIDRMFPRDSHYSKYPGSKEIREVHGSNCETIADFVKALCYITGDNYDLIGPLHKHMKAPHRIYNYTDKVVEFFSENGQVYDSGWKYRTERVKELQDRGAHFDYKYSPIPVYGQEFEWAYFTVKVFIKGTVHFTFKDEELWAKFNQRISKIKGFPLFEGTKKDTEAKKQKVEEERRRQRPEPAAPASRPIKEATTGGTPGVLFTFNV